MLAMNKQKAYIALGANLGNTKQTLTKALELLDKAKGITVINSADFITTAPVGGPQSQPAYTNSAAELEITITPHRLLYQLNKIEAELGRNRQKEERFGPRTCDLDILLIDDLILNSDDLVIPHPRMNERLFVLEPLAQIAPTAIDPKTNLSITELKSKLESKNDC